VVHQRDHAHERVVGDQGETLIQPSDADLAAEMQQMLGAQQPTRGERAELRHALAEHLVSLVGVFDFADAERIEHRRDPGGSDLRIMREQSRPRLTGCCGLPSMVIARPSLVRTMMPQPAGHSRQVEA
jgi:hypothetical protein